MIVELDTPAKAMMSALGEVDHPMNIRYAKCRSSARERIWGADRRLLAETTIHMVTIIIISRNLAIDLVVSRYVLGVFIH